MNYSPYNTLSDDYLQQVMPLRTGIPGIVLGRLLGSSCNLETCGSLLDSVSTPGQKKSIESTWLLGKVSLSPT
ncbi:hypothetical protein PGT21_035680 [Puccinia graminis f. sp. tritici]|uniref:Uncharacterized protein n=1 Tax=Puccinia graminis f. sp. tritici TaxID=56615 RepID=A0A5B0R2R3_PUCGR|nr:hypothetical protein PGT21_035680 [Puccinia graminis f. sp. tritici]